MIRPIEDRLAFVVKEAAGPPLGQQHVVVTPATVREGDSCRALILQFGSRRLEVLPGRDRHRDAGLLEEIPAVEHHHRTQAVIHAVDLALVAIRITARHDVVAGVGFHQVAEIEQRDIALEEAAHRALLDIRDVRGALTGAKGRRQVVPHLRALNLLDLEINARRELFVLREDLLVEVGEERAERPDGQADSLRGRGSRGRFSFGWLGGLGGLGGCGLRLGSGLGCAGGQRSLPPW